VRIVPLVEYLYDEIGSRIPAVVMRYLSRFSAVRVLGACLVASVCLGTIDAGLAHSTGGTGRSCGVVDGRGSAYHVNIFDGRVSCARARAVIQYVLTHGHPTQGSPGKSPSGWSCGYGYGLYHGNHSQSGRAGPNCSRGGNDVQGTQTGYTPSP
jgi:hypothetical protein